MKLYVLCLSDAELFEKMYGDIFDRLTLFPPNHFEIPLEDNDQNA